MVEALNQSLVEQHLARVKQELASAMIFSDKIAIVEKSLIGILERSTSASPETWTQENPYHGQSAGIAALVQHFCGGMVVKGFAIAPDGARMEHYWNSFDGRELDLAKKARHAEAVLCPASRFERFDATKAHLKSGDGMAWHRFKLLRTSFQTVLTAPFEASYLKDFVTRAELLVSRGLAAPGKRAAGPQL